MHTRSKDSVLFFTSRGRHRRLTCDWSSDVCSSDLCAVRWPLGFPCLRCRWLAAETWKAQRPAHGACGVSRSKIPIVILAKAGIHGSAGRAAEERSGERRGGEKGKNSGGPRALKKKK